MTKIIGLTGGIGSGKTTIANFFYTQGIPIYIADEEAKKILQSKRVQNKIVAEFGNEILQKGQIDRSKLASLVFNDKVKLQKLNSIIHPAVATHFKKWLTQHKDKAFVIKEAAVLFESGSYKDCDIVITVIAPLSTRISRVKKRDNTSDESVKERIKNQWTDEQRIVHSDYVIENIDLEESKKKCLEILKELRK